MKLLIREAHNVVVCGNCKSVIQWEHRDKTFRGQHVQCPNCRHLIYVG